jgi:hypothetical protein
MVEYLIALATFLERRLEVNRTTYVTFIDLEKAFDKVNWKLLCKTMKKVGLDRKDRRLILALYRSQNTIIEINGN